MGGYRDKVGKALRRNLAEIPEYVPGTSVEEVKRRYGLKDVVKLASNENPYGPSPRVREVLSSFNCFNVYPNPVEIEELKERICEYVGVDRGQIAIGAGIDGVLDTVFKMLIDPGDRVVIPIPTFQYYHTLSKIYGARVEEVRRGEGFKVIADDVKAVRDAKLVIICSPNNPTGNSEDEDVVRDIVESTDAIVFIDEAYAEFSGKSFVDLIDYGNVIVARTFSKAFGLANLRIGYALMCEDLRRAYEKVSIPFPVSSIAVRCATACIEDLEYVKMCVERIVRERERVYSKLKEIVRAYPSDANFIYFESNVKSGRICDELMRRGVIVRDCSTFRGCGEYGVRVSIGKREENDKFLKELMDVISRQSS